MQGQNEEDTLVSGDVYMADHVPAAAALASEGVIFRKAQREVPRGDACEDSDSDIYTAGGDRDFEDDDSFRAKVREEERKIMSEFNLTGDLQSTTSSSNGGAAQERVTSSPEHLGKKMLWTGSVGTNDDGSIFDNSYNGILDRLRMFTPGQTAGNKANNNAGSPKGTEKTSVSPSNSNSPTPVGPSNSWEDFNVSAVPGPGIVPPSTIIVNTGGQQQQQQQRDKRRQACRIKPSRLIIALAVLLFVAIAVAAGTWAVSNVKQDSSKSAVSDTTQDVGGNGEDDSPEIRTDPPFTVFVPSPSPTIVVAVVEEETVPPTLLPVEETTSPTTNEPSAFPSEALTEEPTAGPTLVPSTGAPSAIPTSEGLSAAPTPCGDDPDVTFLITDAIGEQGCAWLADKPGHMMRFCREGNEGYLYCKRLCGVCSASTTTAAPADTDVSTSAPTTTDEIVEETESPIATSEPTEEVMETEEPTSEPTEGVVQTEEPTSEPTAAETEETTSEPTASETEEPTSEPTAPETEEPTSEPTASETDEPTSEPTVAETTDEPTSEPTAAETDEPTAAETDEPTAVPSTAIRGARETILDFSPSSVVALSNAGSSQARALDWLETSGYENLEEWEIAQTWAVASFGVDSEVSGWFSSGNWLNRAGDECNWFGIECNQEKRVTGISLSQNNMVGNLLPELSLLDTLTTLDVSRNGMSGPFPASIGSLSRLTNLEIDRNRFSGQLPSQIGRLSRLQNLRLEFNRFTGTLPSTLQNLADVEELVIFSNSFTGSVPDEICNMESLFSLEADCREIACDCCTRCWFQCGGNTGIPCN